MRLSKLNAATHFGVSPSTIDRMIQRGQLNAEREPRGTRYKIWVILDDEPGDSPPDPPLDESSDEPPAHNDEPGDSPVSPPDLSAQVEIAKLTEQAKSAEERGANPGRTRQLPQATPHRLGVEIPGDPAATETEPTERISTDQGPAATSGSTHQGRTQTPQQ